MPKVWHHLKTYQLIRSITEDLAQWRQDPRSSIELRLDFEIRRNRPRPEKANFQLRPRPIRYVISLFRLGGELMHH